MRQARNADLTRRADHPELQALLVVVVDPVLRVDDPDVHVERSRQELELSDRKAHHPFGLHRDRDPVDEGVRAEHADAILAVQVHAEHGVAHALRIAITDLDRGRLSRLQNNAVRAVGAEDPGPRDLDLLRTPARPDLAARRALALLLFADLLVVRVDHIVRRALSREDAFVEPDRALAESGNRSQV